MALVGFNIVLVGENFPIQRINAEDFQFNSQPLRQTLRVPIALNAEIPGVNLQVLPNRLQASITTVRPRAITAFAGHLADMVTSFLDLVGTRTLTAVGHNAQFTLGEPGDRARIYSELLSVDTASSILGRPLQAADVNYYVTYEGGSILRVAFLSQSDQDAIVMDFNINFDLIGGNINARSAVEKLDSSLKAMQEIANRAANNLVGKRQK